MNRNSIGIAALAAALMIGALVSPSASSADAAQFERGKAVFSYWCASCHAGTKWEHGQTSAGTTALAVKYGGTKPAALEERTDLVPEFVRAVIRSGIKGMPSFRKTEISTRDADDIAAYLARNLKQ